MTGPLGYKLSEPAARAARGLPPFPAQRPDMTINPQALAVARAKPRGVGVSPFAMDAAAIYAPYAFPDGTYPDGMAMDACLPASANFATPWAVGSLFHEGQGFFGYPLLAELVQRAEYRHACEIWAEHAVRKWIKLVGGSPEERKAIEDELTRLTVRDVFQEWMFHDHVFGRAQIFLDFGDANNPEELRVPLLLDGDKISAKRPLQRLTVVEPLWSAPGNYNTSNPLDGDFYVPRSWFVFGKTVDTSRMLTLASRPVSDMLKPAYAFGGQSLVQLMKPYVDNWLRGRQSASDLLNSFSIINLSTDMSTTMQGGNGQSLFDRVDMFNIMRDNRGAMVTDKGSEELSNLAVPLSSVPDLVSQAQEQMASAARIPLSIYLQITPTGLNATSDGETRNFYADVKAYQEKNVRPHLKRVIDCVQLSLSGRVNPAIHFEFEPLWEMDDKDLADIRKADADAHEKYVAIGAVSNDEVREVLANDEAGLYHGVDLGGPAPIAPGDDEEDQDPTPGAMDEWNEADHPRDDDGKFGSGGGGSSSTRTTEATREFAKKPTVWTSRASGIEYVANALPQVSKGDLPRVRAQQEALEDAFADGADEYFETERVDPAQLKSLQNQVARNQVVNVAEKGSVNAKENGELPLVLRGPDGLILIDGNHRANAALLTGEKLNVQVFDLERWEQAQKAKTVKKPGNSGPDDDELLRELLG